MITELDVVNDALASMGEFPVNEVTEDHGFVSTIIRTLKSNNERCQQQGWWFNKEYLTLIPDAISKFIYVPGDALVVKPFCRGVNNLPFVQRSRQLYDPQNQTLEFSRSVDVELVRRIPFQDLPTSAQSYISAKTVLEFQVAYDADQRKTQMLQARVQEAWAILRAEDIRMKSLNLFNYTQMGGKLSRIGPHYGWGKLATPR